MKHPIKRDGFLPYDRHLVERAREMRKNPTEAERKLWQFLRGLPVRVLRQRPIDRFIVDFYCPELKLVIEVDGIQHFTQEGRTCDRQRTEQLNCYGLQVARFTNTQVLQEFDAVCTAIHARFKSLQIASRSPQTEPCERTNRRIGREGTRCRLRKTL